MVNKMPYLIAEVGVNHENNLETAKTMIIEAARGGASAVKFQSYKAETLASKNSPAYWDKSKEQSKSQYALFKKYDRFGQEEFAKLAQICQQAGVEFLSTPFDFEAVDYLDNLVKTFKIASADINNVPLLKYIAAKKKPIILSTGASTMCEIHEGVDVLKRAGAEEIALLHCILSYPTQYKDANLAMIMHLKSAFPQCKIGYSDHTLPDAHMLVLTTAYLYGAEIIEKHFTLDKALPGNDHYHAMDPDDIRKTVANFRFIQETLGASFKEPIECELSAREHARRSIFAKRTIRKGELIDSNNVCTKRPGHGLPPAMMDYVLGACAKSDIAADAVIRLKDLNFTT